MTAEQTTDEYGGGYGEGPEEQAQLYRPIEQNKTAPSAEQIKRFVEVFESLSAFEGQHHAVRGWGMDLARPDPYVVAVLTWLKEQTDHE